MNETFTLSQFALVSLLTSAFPNPEDDTYHLGHHFGPHDPIGPISRFGEASLNPQPLPPMAGREFARGLKGPRPEPWKGAVVARLMIERTATQLQYAEVMAGREGTGQARETALSSMLAEIDEFCGNVPHRFPRWWDLPIPVPGPDPDPPILLTRINSLVLLTAGVEFSRAAQTIGKGDLQNALGRAADHLFETGLSRLESR